MRRGTWDVQARLRDMDIDGVWASLNFPSHLAGFGGARLQMTTSDRDLPFAVLRAYNEWHLEAWCGANPQRLVPARADVCQHGLFGDQRVRCRSRTARIGAAMLGCTTRRSRISSIVRGGFFHRRASD